MNSPKLDLCAFVPMCSRFDKYFTDMKAATLRDHKMDVRCQIAVNNIRDQEQTSVVTKFMSHFKDNGDVPHCITSFLMHALYDN